MVAPVVVRPEMASKAASIPPRPSAGDRYSGTAPARPRPTQNSATTMKPSRSRSGLRRGARWAACTHSAVPSSDSSTKA